LREQVAFTEKASEGLFRHDGVHVPVPEKAQVGRVRAEDRVANVNGASKRKGGTVERAPLHGRGGHLVQSDIIEDACKRGCTFLLFFVFGPFFDFFFFFFFFNNKAP
jgi:hypothetical protein